MQAYELDSAAAFDALVYGENHPGTVQFMQNQLDFVANTFKDKGNYFIERSRAAFETFNNSNAINYARRVISSIGKNINTEYVITLTELEQMQQASLTMQRWIMANPQIRSMYHNQTIDGYSSTYVDVFGDVKGDAHYDYRRVMNGIMQEDKNGEPFFINYLYDDLRENDRELTFGEQISIIETWSRINRIIDLNKNDPTSPTGGML